ncbi:hypothetical protein AB5I41_22915 [Sphingomonas sp. MMS24-JH45]
MTARHPRPAADGRRGDGGDLCRPGERTSEGVSVTLLGGAGLFGNAGMGRSGGSVFVNAANGNLVLSQSDAMLVGRGTDIDAGRSFNRTIDAADRAGLSQNWRFNQKRIDTALALDQSRQPAEARRHRRLGHDLHLGRFGLRLERRRRLLRPLRAQQQRLGPHRRRYAGAGALLRALFRLWRPDADRRPQRQHHHLHL